MSIWRTTSSSLRAAAISVVEALEIRQLLAQSIWAYPGADGHLLYKTQPLGDHIEDYSTAGYKGGTLPVPDVPVKATVSPVAGDDTSTIQAAINSVAAMPLDANGFRGAVLLNAGTYEVGTQINITTSGIVLRGSGANQTLIHATGVGERTIININGSGTRTAVSGTTHTITDKYVPVGAISFTVDSTANLHVGDQVVVHRPSTQQWINDMGMNLLDNPWTPGSKDINMDRTITHIDGNVITIDAPMTQALDLKYTDAIEGPNQIYVYTANSRLNNVGVESLGGYSDYNPTVVDTNGEFVDEDHPWTFINIDGSTNAWARNVTSQYFGYSCVYVTGNSKYVSVTDSQCLDPVSQITGGRRYSFNLDDSSMVLFRNDYTREGRHDYVEGSTVVGPNVFVDDRADNTHADAGPHHRYSTAALWDNVKAGQINIQDRGNSGTGHGHAGANQVIWNSTASSFIVQSPISAQNWLIGSIGTISAGGGVGFHTPGLIDSSGPAGTGANVDIRSLYYKQLAERMAWENFVPRESRVGDSDNYTNDGATDSNIVDATWKSQVQAASGMTSAGFDTVANGQAVPFTFNFQLDAGMHVVGASLSLGLKSAGGITTSDKIYVENTSRVYTWADLGVTAPTTTAGAVTIDLSKLLAAMQDGKLNIAVAGNTAIDWATLNLQTASTTQPRTSTLTASADAYVQDGTSANSNFGSATTLTTKLDTTNNDRESYVKFDLSALTPGMVVRATVRLVPTTVNYSNANAFGSGKGAIYNQLYLVGDNSWTENGITWNNKPAAAGAMLDEFVSYPNAPLSLDVTSLVKAALAGDKKLSLKLLSDTADTNGQLTFGARENADPNLRPQIIIQSFDNAVAPEADTMVQDGTSANTNFGTSQGLGTKKDVTNENRESYLRFDLSSFTGPLVGATFRLMPTFDGYAYLTNNVDLVTSNSWGETTTTWNNKPAVGTNLATVVPGQSTPTKANVTTQAANSLAGDKKLSLHVASNTTNTNGLTLFGAREHVDPTFTPLLVFKNLLPQITSITNQKTGAGTSSAAAWFGVWDAETAPGALTLSAVSSNTTLLPNSNIAFGGSGADRTITLTPAANQSGAASVTVTVADAQGQTAQTTFQLSVTTALTVNGDQDDVDEPDVIRLVRSGTFLNVYRNDPLNPILHLDYATAPAIAVNSLGGDDTITVDYSGGNPVPANGLTIDGGDGSDTLNIVNSAGNDAVTLTAGNVSFGAGAALAYSNAEVMSLGLGSGQDTLTVAGNGGVSVGALNLSVAGAGKVTMTSGSTLPDFTDLSIGNATFDLNGQNQTIDALTGSGTVLNNGASLATLTVGQVNGGGTFGGTLANGTSTLALSKVGTGTQTLSGSNSYTGATTVDNGALRVTNAAALGATSGGTTINGGTSTGRVEFTGGITVAEPFTLGNRTGGGGGNFAAHLLNVSGDNTLIGAITLATGGSYWTIQSNAGKLTVVGNLTNANTSNARTLYLRGAGDGEVTGAILQTSASLTQVNKEDAGTWTLSGNNTYTGATSANGGTLRLAISGILGGGAVNVGPAALFDVAAGRSTALKIPSLLIASGGTMDLQDNSLIVGSATPPATIQGYIQLARNGGAWDGTGLTSSAAKNNPQHNTTLGLLIGAEYDSVGGAGTFAGQSYSGSDSLIKYTYYGDSDFNGKVNFDDYVRTDNGFNNHLSGWLNGDFDLNGQVNFDDYVLIDLAFNTQSGTLRRALPRTGKTGTAKR